MTMDEYMEGAPEPQRSTLNDLRDTLRRILPDAEETMSYNMPAFKVEGKAVGGFAWFKNHCSFFPHSGTVLPELAEQLEGYEWTKGTLKFGVDEPLPEDLVRRVVEVRLTQLGLG
ncbi:MAG TPA: DUF1801 domain-containing protein [Acidimicrobiia bacterium]|nr:DUF1801 domain-containing protein [Acidimicrobiia bacterium]